MKNLQIIIQTRLFGTLYAVFAALVLAGSTVLWALLGAKLHQQNADQLVNAYLFENSRVFQQALLPENHSFLIKWPLFLIVKLFGLSNSAYIIFTILTVVVTVVAFAYLLYRIERRHVYIGTIWLAMASALMLVPAQPAPGALLPVTMAMLTTRNLEYVVFIFFLVLVIRATSWRSRSFGAAIAGLALLIASDRLFLYLSLGGALLFGMAYGLRKIWHLRTIALQWLSATLLGAVGAMALIWAVNALGLTSITGSGDIGPYGFISSPHQLVVGSVYALVHLLTTFGANPAFETLVLHEIPGKVFDRLFGISGLSFVVNLVVVGLGMYTAWACLRDSLRKSSATRLPAANVLSLMLVACALVSLTIFVVTNHYYAGDARYLSITFFALFVCIATYVRYKNISPQWLVGGGVVLVISTLLAIPTALNAYTLSSSVMAPFKERNQRVASAINRPSPGDATLVGDYWRVIPIRAESKENIKIMPLADCTTPRSSLTSTAWNADLGNSGFVYLLSLDDSLTDYPRCTLDAVTAVYGNPSSVELIAGNRDKPVEVLLFYPDGVQK